MPIMSEDGGIARRFPALQTKGFRIFFSGLCISVSGPWMQTTAQAWLVLKLTGSSLSLATVTALQFTPIMLLALVGGAVADRFPRRKLMIVTQTLAALQALALGLLAGTGAVTITHVYLLAISLGIINALDAPLRQSFASELVPTPQLPNAIALVAMVQNLGRIVGPALGGVVIAALGVEAAFLVNAASFAAILYALLRLRSADIERKPVAGRRGMLGEIGESLVYARGVPTILLPLIATGFIGMFGQNFTTIIPLVATFLIHANAAEFGILNSCLGAGSFFAAFLMTARGEPGIRRILLSGLGFGIILIAISLSSSLWLSSALFFAVGAAAVTFSTSVTASMQIQSPPHMRGRFASMVHLLITGSSPLGALLTGAVAEASGVWAAVMLNGLLCCLGMTIAFTYWRRHDHAQNTIPLAADREGSRPAEMGDKPTSLWQNRPPTEKMHKK